MPKNPLETTKDDDAYTREIAICELSNLKYVPSFRAGDDKTGILKALKAGFMLKYEDVKKKKEELLLKAEIFFTLKLLQKQV